MSLTSFTTLAAFTAADYAVLFFYLIAVVAMGIWLGRGQSTLAGYFLANRKAPWIVACFSIIATDFSAISYMGFPAWVYDKDLKYIFLCGLLTPLSFVAVVLVFVPIYHRLQVFTVYEYLEKRFHPLARTVTSILFLFQRGVWMASAIFIPSLALSTVADLDFVTPMVSRYFPSLAEFITADMSIVTCIVGIGLLTTIYTMLGGMRAVLWTDFIQLIIMMGGLILMIGIQLHAFGWDMADVWSRAGEMTSAAKDASGAPYPKTALLDWTFNFRTEATVWAMLFFLLIYNLGTYGTDQVVAQRYFTMGSKREMVRSVMSAGFLTVPVVFLLGLAGILFAVYYQAHPELIEMLPVKDPAAEVPERKIDAVLPVFVVHVLPAGVRGLIFAALFAATMSSVSSGLNSFATVGVMDLYRRHFGGARRSERHNFILAKVFTLVCGVAATIVAWRISVVQTTIVQTLGSLASMFIGPISGIFLLGAFTKRGNLPGVVVGALCGLVVSCAINMSMLVELLPFLKSDLLSGPVTWLTDRANLLNWMWTAPLSSLVTFVVGAVVSVAWGDTGANGKQHAEPEDIS